MSYNHVMIYDSNLQTGYYDLEALVFTKFSIRDGFMDMVKFLNEKGYTILFNYDAENRVFFNLKR